MKGKSWIKVTDEQLPQGIPAQQIRLWARRYCFAKKRAAWAKSAQWFKAWEKVKDTNAGYVLEYSFVVVSLSGHSARAVTGCISIRQGEKKMNNAQNFKEIQKTNTEHPPQEEPGIRYAECTYGCGTIRPSSPGLAFFKAYPTQKRDTFYCGCWGWD